MIKIELIDSKLKNIIGFNHLVSSIDLKTDYGKKLIISQKPFLKGEEEELRKYYNDMDFIKELVISKSGFLMQVNPILSHIKDILGTVVFLENDNILTEVQLFEIKNQLISFEKLYNLLKLYPKKLRDIIKIENTESLLSLLNPKDKKTSTYYLYEDYSEGLRNIRDEKNNFKSNLKKIIKERQAFIKSEIGLDFKIDDTIIINKEDTNNIKKARDMDCLIEVSENLFQVIFELRKDNEILKLESEIERLIDREEEEEFNIRQNLSIKLKKEIHLIKNNIDYISKLDLYLGKIKYSLKYPSVIPKISINSAINIKNAVHPIINEELKKTKKNFTPISIKLEKGLTIITGANMGGKTISLKTIGLLTLMTHYGYYIPSEYMEISLRKKIYISLGDRQNEKKGLSTFGGEIMDIKNIIDNLSDDFLILLDELGSGTNPKEGYAISKAIGKYFATKNLIAIITTHFEGLTDINGAYNYQVIGLRNIDKNLIMDEMNNGKDNDVLEKYMDYRLEKISKDNLVPKEAIMIADILGLKKDILNDAKNIIKENNKEG